ncbi:CCHC-type domain-containing protein [Citrus sinensis]|uniref:CCHC-type domain-containing protein n=1 Tax=Citrus sinensis TaxID=2711 RepID=A0ACB8MLQ4_CITSI|nr:CCHC-type domain-containing protein [Citrus sinensis]
MAKRPDPDDDDDFSELYKEYTGPPGSMVATSQEKAKANKRSLAGSDEEEEPRDPNAVPTDFTSREAKVWEAKSKATERNWKKRKEEEMICKICGESGHFTQGCPSTLGANRKSQDFFERVAARDKHVRALFTEKVIQRIEKDISCKIKMDEKFIIVSGKDRLILSKGVDAVHKIIKEEGDQRGTSSSHKSKSRSPERSPVGTQLRRSESQRSHPVSHNASHFHQRICRQDKVVEDRVREDVQKFSRGSPQGRDSIGYLYGIHRKPQELKIPTMLASRIKCLTYSSFHEAYGSDGARGRSSHSKSPGRPPYASNLHNSYDGHNQSMGGYRNDGWDIERRGSDMQSGHQFEYPAFPKTLDELELDYTREAMELGRIRDKEEDEENYKHRETIREMRESYMKKLTQVRAMHAKQWEEFLQLDGQRHQHQAREQMSASGFGGYKQHNYSSYDGSSTNSEYAGTSYPMDSRGRYPNPMETYPSRAHDTHGGFQRQRREEFGKAYNRY